MIRRLFSRLVYFLEGVWLPINANLCGLYHLIRGHNVEWFKDPDLWGGHLGWIYCTHCPDTEESETDLVIWGFYFHRISRFIIQPICGLLGHKEAAQSMTCDPDDDSDNPVFDRPTGRWYCSRCGAEQHDPSLLVV